jgi:uncharacterized protein YkwD
MANELIAFVNAAREARHVPPVSSVADLTQDALIHAEFMAQHQVVEDDPQLGVDVCCWSVIGENSGVASSVSLLDSTFMASPPHRANILNPQFTQIGVAVVSSHNLLWAAEIFRRPS